MTILLTTISLLACFGIGFLLGKQTTKPKETVAIKKEPRKEPRTTADYIEQWCKDYGYEFIRRTEFHISVIMPLKDLRIDVFPANMKYHDVTNNQRGVMPKTHVVEKHNAIITFLTNYSF